MRDELRRDPDLAGLIYFQQIKQTEAVEATGFKAVTVGIDAARWVRFIEQTGDRRHTNNMKTRLKMFLFALIYWLRAPRKDMVEPNMLKVDAKGDSVYGWRRDPQTHRIVPDWYELP